MGNFKEKKFEDENFRRFFVEILTI